MWVQKQFVFDIHNPTFSFLRFTVYDEDMFSDPNFLAQATYPVQLLRTGDSGRSFTTGQVLCLLLTGLFLFRLQKRASEKQLQRRPGAGVTPGPRGNRQCQGRRWTLGGQVGLS